MVPSSSSSTWYVSIDDWYSKHVHESQYLLQVLKCTNVECCCSTRSSLRYLLPDWFLLPPIKIKQTSNGFVVSEPCTNDGIYIELLARLSLKLVPKIKDFIQIPYDWFCPSIHNKLIKRVCNESGLYHNSNTTKTLPAVYNLRELYLVELVSYYVY